MARKGDIDSKSVASRVPMEVYLAIQRKAFEDRKTISNYISELLINNSVEVPNNDNLILSKTKEIDRLRLALKEKEKEIIETIKLNKNYKNIFDVFKDYYKQRKGIDYFVNQIALALRKQIEDGKIEDAKNYETYLNVYFKHQEELDAKQENIDRYFPGESTN